MSIFTWKTSMLIQASTMPAAFGYWGFHGDKSIWMKWVLGIGTPLAAAILWGLILAPRAGRCLNITAGSILSLALFCLAAAALYQSGQPALANHLCSDRHH